MYGEGAYATGPYAALVTVLFVAACITTGDDLAFTVSVGDQLVTTMEVSIHSC